MKRLLSVSFILYLSTLFTFSQETVLKYLSGTGSDHTVEWEFFCTEGMKSGFWTTILVPSNWETEGFGGYNYGYNREEGRAKEKGMYRYTFEVPEKWDDKKVNIVFEGSMTDTEVKINGILAGPVHQGAFYRFKYGISDKLKFGDKNLLEVTVSKISDNASVNKAERNADYWIFGGIFRPVYLEVLPGNHIKKVAVDANYKGMFTAEVVLSETNTADELLVKIYRTDDQKLVSQESSEIKLNNPVKIETRLLNPDLWSPEKPYLYRAEFSILKNGEILHILNEKFGFRTLEVRERDGVYLNGVKIKFKGVNRHSFRPSTGRTLNRSQCIEDAILIKDMNMNAVRNSHYPADPEFYEACDSLGIMVLDELGGWHDAYDTEVGSVLVKEMIEKSQNHPSVVMWINGNEGGHNRELLPLYESLDIQKRHVIQAWENFRGLDTQHYRDYNYGNGNHYQGHDIVLPTEFLHGLYDGGHGAGLEDFWKLMWDNPLSAGGFLWNFADEAVIRTDKNDELDSDGNHGADGILGPYHEKEGSYFTIKEVWAPVYFEHREITENFDGKLIIENRYHFTNIHECSFTWKLKRFSDPFGMLNESEKQGKVNAPDIVPGDDDTLFVRLPADWRSYDALYITAQDPFQKEIFTWSWPISLPKQMTHKILKLEGNTKPVLKETDSLYIVTTQNMEFGIGKNSGMLRSVKKGKQVISLADGPVILTGDVLHKKTVCSEKDNQIIIESIFDEESAAKEIKWSFYPSGWVRLDVEYCPPGERHEWLGISFSYPEKMVQGIQWLGDGPYRVWKNRMKGNCFDVWNKDYNNTITGQSEYIYPEFKGYHSGMYWLNVHTEESDFMVMTPDEDIFFRMYTPGTPKDPYNTAPEFPVGDISFMHGINPMGTKTLQPFRMGPMSEENIYYTYGCNRSKKMTLYFYFGDE